MSSTESKAKPLYLAESLARLNETVDVNSSAVDILKNNSLLLVRRLFSHAQRSKLDGDEENAYVLFMRLISLFRLIEKSNLNAYFANDIEQIVGEAIDEAELLSKRLEERYRRHRVKNNRLPSPPVPEKPKNDPFDTHIDSRTLHDFIKKDPKQLLIIHIQMNEEQRTHCFLKICNVVWMDAEKLDNLPTKPSFPNLCHILSGKDRELFEHLNNFSYVVIVENERAAERTQKVYLTIEHRMPQRYCAIPKSRLMIHKDGFFAFQLYYPYEVIGTMVKRISSNEEQKLFKVKMEERPPKPPSNGLQIEDNHNHHHHHHQAVLPAPLGLPNFGNTCYLNSAIQCLCSIDFFCKYFASDEYLDDLPSKKTDSFALMFADLVRAIRPHHRRYPYGGNSSSSSSSAFSVADRFVDRVLENCREFRRGRQEDAHELIQAVLDTLHKDLNKSDNTFASSTQNKQLTDEERADPQKMWQVQRARNSSIIVDCFQGLMEFRTKCDTCSAWTISYEIFGNLTVNIEASTDINECIERTYRDEHLTKDSGYICEKCKNNTDATRFQRLHSLPPVLIVVLSRYEHVGNYFGKIRDLIDFSVDNLILSSKLTVTRREAKYKLSAICNHRGNATIGHYTAFVRHVDNQWYHCDDSRVEKVNDTSILVSPAAYMLIYTASV